MGETEDGDHFKDALLQFLEINEHEEIRETCEAIRQMYQVDLIDVIDQVFEDEQDKGEPFKAAGLENRKFIFTSFDSIHS